MANTETQEDYGGGLKPETLYREIKKVKFKGAESQTSVRISGHSLRLCILDRINLPRLAFVDISRSVIADWIQQDFAATSAVQERPPNIGVRNAVVRRLPI